MSNRNNIGRRIEDLRTQKGITQKQLADAMSVRRETVNQWESNTRDLKTEKTIALAEYFNVTCDYILRGVQAENVDFCEKTGLSDQAVSVLESLSNFKHKEIIDCANYLLMQEEPCPAEEFPEWFTEGEQLPENIEKAQNAWEKKNLVPILEIIWDYIRSRPTDDDFFIDALGNIQKINRSKSGLSCYVGVSLDGLRTIHGNEIIEQVLLSKVTDTLKKQRERYVHEEAKNNGVDQKDN